MHVRDRLIAVVDVAEENAGGDDPVARILDRVADGIEAASVRLDLTGQFAALDARIESPLPDAQLRSLATTRHILAALVDDVNELITAVRADAETISLPNH
ncbi:hypothetical protein BJF79_09365 [Actinomadura sp. CNU-125]|uniref:hypothetical protein n=1 Tax=Actinomadura sp. CNU-125 TaxID=1904961 RepID=UPI000968D5C1|nr:hypothetical protein [Actinomadura sp. CNU-125]OLT30795.1 hypothetical protein BJF79_09365 [Actinomadura sp. CNU-125]